MVAVLLVIDETSPNILKYAAVSVIGLSVPKNRPLYANSRLFLNTHLFSHDLIRASASGISFMNLVWGSLGWRSRGRKRQMQPKLSLA